MLILALDTTTRAGSVAVTDDDRVLAVVEGDPARTHGERLPGEVARVLAQAGIGVRDVGLLAVASGPGAFTGLRIGLAAMQGLAMVLRVPVVGVSALDAIASLAWLAPPGPLPARLVVWTDAQRGEVFAAVYDTAGAAVAADPWHPVGPPLVGGPAAVLASLTSAGCTDAAFAGEGAARHETVIAAWSHGRARVVPLTAPLAPALARLGHRRAARGAAGPPHALQPLYIRRPDAELERARRTP